VSTLEAAGYDGWYVLEQDTVLTGPSSTPLDDVSRSASFLHEVA
jgi:inosose dehydratase